MIKQKIGRRVLFYSVIAVVVLLVLVGNIAFAFCSQSYQMHIDLTDEKLYTMSEKFVDELETVQSDVDIIFCADPDVLMKNETTRIVYYMAQAMSLRFKNIHVKTVDILKNPGAIQEFKTTSASEFYWDDIIISTATGYRVRNAESFWLLTEDGSSYWSYNGEYEMATVILSLLTVEKPKICVTYGHGEDDIEEAKGRAFYQMIPDKLNVELVFINLDTMDIPKDCVLLLMDGPTVDYRADLSAYEGDNSLASDYFDYVSPTEKIGRFLDNFGSLLILKDPFVDLPVLEEFLEEWGISFSDTLIKDKTMASANRTRLIADYANAKDHVLGHSLYSDLANLATAPSTVMENSGAITSTWKGQTHYFSSSYTADYSPLLLSSGSSQAYNRNEELVDREGKYHLASLVRRNFFGSETGESQYSYVLAAATTAMIDDAYVSDHAYANREILFAAMRTMISTRTYSAMDVTINNSSSYGGKILRGDTLYQTDTEVLLYGEIGPNGFTATQKVKGLSDGMRTAYAVILLSLPTVLILGTGVWVFVRRRRL